MNYLAHLFLADDRPESIIGNLLGDFLQGISKDRYSIAIQQGIELHRKVDAYTDSHLIVKEAKQLVSASRRKFAGILLDVFYDHFLARYWQNYSSVTLDEFSQKVYVILSQNQSILPDRLKRALPQMIQQDWLNKYQYISGIEVTLNRMAHRVSRQGEILASGIEELTAHYQELDRSFQSFFPELIGYVKTTRSHLKYPDRMEVGK
ncbi:ACP phosphodiesterase [cyanobacterium TDX16]|nr:ACP phosphodiesterase [cyanobacterium TDX16]